MHGDTVIDRGMHIKRARLTIFPLDVPQQLRNPPLQNNHLNRRYALGRQPCVYSLQHSLFLVCRNEDPSHPVGMRFGKLSRLVLRDELPRWLAHQRYHTRTPTKLT